MTKDTSYINRDADLIEHDIEGYLRQHEQKDMLRFLTAGSVDDGKSTLIGRLLYDSKMIDPDDLPLTAVLVVPNSKKSETLLRGRYQDNAALQMLQPIKVVEELLGVVFSIKRFLDANLIVVALAVSMLFALVVMLSLRLRQREMEIMFMMGCARSTMFKLQLAELGIVLGISAALAVVTAGLAAHYIPGLLGV